MPQAAIPGGTAAGSAIPTAGIKGQGAQQRVPFRLATIERTETHPARVAALTAATQPFSDVMEGTGYLFGIMLDVVAVEAGNAVNPPVFFEDSPFSALAQVVLSDPSGDLVNVTGHDLELINLAHKNYAVRDTEASAEIFTQLAVGGPAATDGGFSFQLRVPAGINRKTLLGILGNQDRSVKFTLRTDFATWVASAIGPIYTTSPTNAPTMTVNRIYENYSVPPANGPAGPQAVFPDGFGTLSFCTSTFDAAVPVGGATINHYLRRISNTMRYIVIVLRSATLRATAQVAANQPTRIALKIGDTDLFNESYRYRRGEMYRRFGFNWPNGTLIYDTMHDNVPGAGNEFGFDWMNTQNVNTAQFQIAYPAGFGAANNSIKFITSDLALVGQPVGS